MPRHSNAGQGRGFCRGPGGGRGRGRRAGMGGGPVGQCVCPKCGDKVAHQRGVPCRDQVCPKCGIAMIRE